MASWELKLKRNNPLCATTRSKQSFVSWAIASSFLVRSPPPTPTKKTSHKGEGFLWWWIRPHWIMDIKKSREYKEMQQIRGQSGLTLYHPFKSLFFEMRTYTILCFTRASFVFQFVLVIVCFLFICFYQQTILQNRLRRAPKRLIHIHG